jgi:hypothetical protein
MSKDDLRRYTVGDGYTYYTSWPRPKPQDIHPAGTVLNLTQERVDKDRQGHKLATCDEVLVRCNDCQEEFATSVVRIQYAVCTHCGKRGGDLVGPLPKDWEESPEEGVPDGEGTDSTPEAGTGDSTGQANDSGEKTPEPEPEKAPAKPKKAAKTKKAPKKKKKGIFKK